MRPRASKHGGGGSLRIVRCSLCPAGGFTLTEWNQEVIIVMTNI